MREAAAEDRLGGSRQPFVQQGGVDAAVVGVHAQVAVVEVGQAGVVAVDAAFDPASGEEHDAGGAVVCPGGAVFFDTPTELGEGHGHDIVGPALKREIVVERRDTVRQVAEQVGVLAGLVGVGVETAEADIVDPGADPAGDQLGDGLQARRQAAVCRVFGRAARFDIVIVKGFLQLQAAAVGLAADIADELGVRTGDGTLGVEGAEGFHLLLFVPGITFKAEIGAAADDRRRNIIRKKRQGQGGAESDARQGVALEMAVFIEVAGQPAGALPDIHLRAAGLPDIHALEMAAVRVRVADPRHYGQLALLEEAFERPHARMQADGAA